MLRIIWLMLALGNGAYIRLIPHVFGCMAQVRGAQSLHSWGTSDQEKKRGNKDSYDYHRTKECLL